jgi:AraC-like DNA-binding protein
MEKPPGLHNIEHGTSQRPESTPPGIGVHVRTRTFNIAYVPPHKIDMRLISPNNFLVMQLGPARAMAAFDSDKLRPLQLGPGYPILGLTGTEFSCRAVSTQGVVVLHFDDQHIDAIARGNEKRETILANTQSPRYDEHLMHIFRLIHSELVQPAPDAIYLEYLLSASIVRSMHVATEAAAPSRSRIPSNRLERAEEYLRAHLDQSLRLGDIAQIAHMSPYHFTRAFKAYFGEPPYRYLQRIRLNKAIEMLGQTRLPMEDIAVKVGFSSASHFGSFFSRQMGMSPGVFRTMLN